MSKILVVADLDGNRLKDSTLELVTLARETASALSCEWVSAVLGDAPRAAADDLARRGGGRVLAVADPALATYTADAWTAALARVVVKEGATLVLVVHGPAGWDFSPRLAARVKGSPASEVTAVRAEGAKLVFTRKMFGGRLEAEFELAGSPAVITVQRGSKPAHESTEAGTVVDFAADLPADTVRAACTGTTQSAGGKIDLTQADVIVSGGRSLGGPEKFDLIRDLATALGGQVGASRPVTDSGWLPPEHQVGSSGVTVSPKLYVACGISGAIQHVVGMKSSRFIVAINKDARAPIFEVAHAGVVGDLFEIVPALTAAVREAKAR